MSLIFQITEYVQRRPFDYVNVRPKNYNSIHIWLRKNHGKANHCESKNCSGENKVFDWAKLPKVEYGYKRDNFIQLCRVCHRKMDWINNGITNQNTKKNQCLKGHKFNRENTYFHFNKNTKSYARHCRECTKRRGREYYARTTANR